MVNGAHVKNVPGRKTDMADCQWLAELHAHGLLEPGFVPAAPILRLRDYQRLRQDHIEMGSQHILHMQKALERMNVKVHDVLSQLTGWSGLQIIQAILQGEREPAKLADLCDGQVLIKKRDRLIESLRGGWKEEHLFALRQGHEGWQFYQGQMAACDQQIAVLLEQMSKELLQTVQGMGMPVGEGLRLRQAYADAAGQGTVVWRMNTESARAATAELQFLFQQLSSYESTPSNHVRGYEAANRAT